MAGTTSDGLILSKRGNGKSCTGKQFREGRSVCAPDLHLSVCVHESACEQ